MSSLVIDNGDSKLNKGYANKRALMTTMMEMKYAGLIDYTFGDDVDKKGNRDGYDNHCKMDGGNTYTTDIGSMLIGKWLTMTAPYFPKASFSDEVYVKATGVSYRYQPNLKFLSTNNRMTKKEHTDKQKQAMNDKNVLIFFIPFHERNGRDVTTRNGVLNAKLCSELDAKIDDGRPETGTLIGTKTIYGFYTPDEDVCYDQNNTYLATKESKNGCNIIKVMEDVK